MSPDWSAQEEPVPYAKLDNPQSLNLYSYVYNNPLTSVDADGHWPAVLEEAAEDVAEATEAAGAVVIDLTPVVAIGQGAYVIKQLVDPPKVGQSDADEIAQRDANNRIKLDNGNTLFPAGPHEDAPEPAPAPAAAGGARGTGGKGRLPKPPNQSSEHTSGASGSTHDPHTAPRPGRPNTKDRVKPSWRSHKQSTKDQPVS